MIRVLVTSVGAVVPLGACTTPDSSSTAPAPRDEKVYRMGRNIPVREPLVHGVRIIDPNSMPEIRGGGKGG